MRSAALGAWVVGLLIPAMAHAAPILFSASGANAAAIQGAVDAFRAALGDPNNGNAPGPLGSGRREINWDGGGALTPSPAGTPFNGFLNNRGAQFTTPGTGFLQAQPADLGDPSFDALFEDFSPVRVFTPVGSNVTDARFFVPGTNGGSPATTSGFGAIFSDVDFANTTKLEFFDGNNALFFSAFVPAIAGANKTFSFLGVRFDAGEQISSVRITTGSGPLSPSTNDAVVIDDLLFAEPVAVPEPGTIALVTLGLAGARALRRRAR
jgi:hypothetical protein